MLCASFVSYLADRVWTNGQICATLITSSTNLRFVPLAEHDSGPTRTRLGDLAVLCANRHRMVHRGKPWLTLVELKTTVAAHRA